MCRYFWKPIVVSANIQKLVHFCGAMRLYAKASLIGSIPNGGNSWWGGSYLFAIHPCVGRLGEEIQVMEVKLRAQIAQPPSERAFVGSPCEWFTQPLPSSL